MNGPRCVRVVVRGRVQGVGFRHFVWSRATGLGIEGVVRNLDDGGVEIEAWGEPAQLEELVELARSGPPSARVTDVEVRYETGKRPLRGFHIGSDPR